MWFTGSTKFVAFLHLFTSPFTAQRKRILLSASVGFLTGSDKSAAGVLSCAMLCPIVVDLIHLLIRYNIYISEFDAPETAIVTLLLTEHTGRGVILSGKETCLRLGRVVD